MSNSTFLTPVSRTTRTGDICRKLTHHVIRGDWREGDRLPPERDLCRQLAVGRASLREALKALEIMGMIETRHGEGTFVCARSEFLSRPILWALTTATGSSLHELVELRRLLEIELASLAAKRATAKDLKMLGEAVRGMEKSLGDPKAYLEGDLAFHLALAGAVHNSVLSHAIELIRNLMKHDLMSRWIKERLRQENIAKRVLDEHRRILEAVKTKDSSGAREAMIEHMQVLQELYSKDGPYSQMGDDEGYSSQLSPAEFP